jgi:hypothetical protein
MEKISADIVERIWRRFGGMSPSEGPSRVQVMSEEQPLLLAYLMTMGEEDFNQDERELLLYVGMVVWQIMKEGAVELPQVDEDTLRPVEKKNLNMLDYLQSEPESDFEDTVKIIFENYNQTEVLRYVLDAIMEETEDGAHVRDENKGLMLYFLKNLIDCLDAATMA